MFRTSPKTPLLDSYYSLLASYFCLFAPPFSLLDPARESDRPALGSATDSTAHYESALEIIFSFYLGVGRFRWRGNCGLPTLLQKAGR